MTKKLTKKLFVFAIVVIMLLTFLPTAFAEGTGSTADNDGTITIINAFEGTTYSLYLAFDVTYATVGTTTKPTYSINTKEPAGTDADSVAAREKKQALVDAILAAASDTGKDSGGNVYTDGGHCSFKLTPGVDGFYYVSQKEGYPEVAGRGWLKTQLENFTLLEEKTATSEVVTFEDVHPGYFLITSTAEGEEDPGAVVTVNTNAPNATVIDKNLRTPSNVTKDSPNYSQEMNSDVPFTVSFEATNFRVNALYSSDRVMSYTLTDTVINGLDFKTGGDDTVFGDTAGTIKLYKTKKDDGTFEDELLLNTDKTVKTPVDGTGENAGKTIYPAIEYTYDSTTNKIVITWGDSTTEGTTTTTSSRYPSTCWVVIDYDMTVNEDIIQNDGTNDVIVPIENEIDVKMKLDDVVALEDVGDDKDIVHTAAISIRKVDATTDAILSGAQFVLIKKETSGDTTTEKYWVWDDTNKTMSWTTTFADATIRTADNLTATAEFFGLQEGTYYMREVTAPEGYQPPENDFQVVITAKPTGTNGDYFTITVDGVATSFNATGDFYTTKITNKLGSNLPSTGGMGTTIIYIVGAILLIGAGVVLIIRKRMSAQR